MGGYGNMADKKTTVRKAYSSGVRVINAPAILDFISWFCLTLLTGVGLGIILVMIL